MHILKRHDNRLRRCDGAVRLYLPSKTRTVEHWERRRCHALAILWKRFAHTKPRRMRISEYPYTLFSWPYLSMQHPLVCILMRIIHLGFLSIVICCVILCPWDAGFVLKNAACLGGHYMHKSDAQKMQSRAEECDAVIASSHECIITVF